jgi:hypothetical protein
MTRFRLIILLMGILLSAVNCGISDQSGGSGSQTTNGFTVSVNNDSLTVTAEKECTAELFGSDYLPLDDSGYRSLKPVNDGSCIFSSLEENTYTLVLNDTTENISAVIQNIPVRSTSTFFRSDSLTPPGTLSGTVIVSGEKTAGTLIYIKGTAYLTLVDSGGSYLFSRLPLGTYSLSIRKSNEIITKDILYTEKVTIDSPEQEKTFNITIDP